MKYQKKTISMKTTEQYFIVLKSNLVITVATFGPEELRAFCAGKSR